MAEARDTRVRIDFIEANMCGPTFRQRGERPPPGLNERPPPPGLNERPPPLGLKLGLYERLGLGLNERGILGLGAIERDDVLGLYERPAEVVLGLKLGRAELGAGLERRVLVGGV